MQPTSAPELIREADRCVKCGLCLPECPTYRLSQDENESPRGRIALIEGVARGQLHPDRQLTAHLDRCLLCRRCERVCPSQVRYGDLMERARLAFSTRTPRFWHGWLANAGVLRTAAHLASLLPTIVSRPFGRLHRMHRLARALGGASPPPSRGDHVTPRKPARGRVGLFTGCATAAQQGGALHAAVHLLGHAGFTTVIPDVALCCGALEQHAGATHNAARRAAANRGAFDASLTAVLSVASGCGTQLDSYDPPLPAPHYDVHRFLLEQGGFSTADFRPLDTPVLLHTPCSMANIYRGGDRVKALLSLVPGIRIIPVGEPGQCCGAAGDYLLRYPQTADALRQPLLDQVPPGGAALLLTSNIGCAMHLAEGLRFAGAETEVLHPVELLARQLRDGSRSTAGEQG